MGKISIYDQNKLASSLVGTPGVDSSEASVWATVAAEANEVQNTLTTIQRQDYLEQQRELHRREAEQRAVERQLASQKRQTKVAANNSEITLQLSDLLNKTKDQYRNDTAGAMQAFNTQSQDLIKQFVDNIPDELERLDTQQAASGYLASFGKELGTWKYERDIGIAKSNVEQTGFNFQKELNDPSLPLDAVRNRIENFNKNFPAYQAVFGGEADKKLYEDRQKGIENYLSQLAASGDEDGLKTALDAFPDELLGGKKQQFAAALRREVLERKQELELDRKAKLEGQRVQAFAEVYREADKVTGAIPQAKVNELNNKYPGAFKAGDLIGFTKGQLVSDMRSERLLKQQQKLTEKAEIAKFDKVLAAEIGARTADLEKIKADMSVLQNRMYDKNVPKEQRNAALKELSLKTEQYNQAVAGIRSMSAAIQTDSVKKEASSHYAAVVDKSAELGEKLKKTTYVMETEKTRETLLSKLKFKNQKTGDARRDALYNYYYKNEMDNEIQKHLRAGKLNKFDNDRYLRRLDIYLREYANTRMQVMIERRLKGK